MFKEVSFADVKENITDLLKNKWGLVTAGDESSFNTMTVSWGAAGELWGMDMATIYIRPQRYTAEFLDRKDYFTVSFYPDNLKKQIHGVCGSESGRDVDKVKLAKITPAFDEAAPYFEEAELVLVCKKRAKGSFDPSQFIDGQIDKNNYPQKDYHYIYYGSIEKTLIKE